VPDPVLSDAELSARYGFAMAVLNGNPELKALFQRAVAATYTPERFQAELRATAWYQRTSENQRNAQVLQAADPETYARNVEQLRVKVSMMAAELGASVSLSQGDLGGMVNHFLQYGYDDNEIRQTLSGLVQYTDGRLLGQAGQWETELRSYAQKQGVTLSDPTILSYVRSAIGGTMTINDALTAIRTTATSAYPHLAGRMAAGETVADIADPYRQTMASLLEMNPESLTVADPTIKMALQSKDSKGQPVLRTLYDFENDLRKDKRWLKTKGAQDQAMNTVNRVLQDFGLGGS
jgi:hypothetical protein